MMCLVCVSLEEVYPSNIIYDFAPEAQTAAVAGLQMFIMHDKIGAEFKGYVDRLSKECQASEKKKTNHH